MKPAKPLKELIIVAGVFMAVFIFHFLIISGLFGNRALDINMHDTYYVIPPSLLTNVVMPFLWLITIIYLVRVLISYFKNRLQNVILLISCFFLNVIMLYGLKATAVFEGMNTAFSRSPGFAAHKIVFHSHLQTFLTIQIILILLLVIIAVITGKNWHKAVYETKV